MSNGGNGYLFPSRGDTLGPGHYWGVDEFSEGAVILDISVRRFEAEAGRWTTRREGAPSGNANESRLTFGMPLFAPVSGVVKSVWRNFPDNPAVGERDVAPPGEFITPSGNHVIIEADDGENFLIAHMQCATIPERLCPFTDKYMSRSDRIGSYRAASFIANPADRPRVQQGEFIGRAGNSGRSGGPHIHIAANSLIDDTHMDSQENAHRFVGGWRQPFRPDRASATSAWVPMTGEEFTSAAGHTLFLPSPALRRDTGTAGPVTHVALAWTDQRMLVSATRDTDERLRLDSWQIHADGLLERRDTAAAGPISDVAATRFTGTSRLATAVRDSDRRLRVIGWGVDGVGGLQRLPHDTTGEATHIRAVSSPQIGGAITAARDTGGRLRLDSWVSEPGTVAHAAAVTGPPVTRLAATLLPGSHPGSFRGVAVAAVGADGNLLVTTWAVTDSGRQVHAVGQATAGRVDAVSVAGVAPDLLVTAVRDSEQQLRVIAWHIGANGDLARRGTAVAGKVHEVAAAPVLGRQSVLTAVRREDGTLAVIVWWLPEGGREIVRTSGAQAGAASSIAAASMFIGTGDLITAVGMRDSDGALRVITYKLNAVQ